MQEFSLKIHANYFHKIENKIPFIEKTVYLSSYFACT
jgi:hypothetical protein